MTREPMPADVQAGVLSRGVGRLWRKLRRDAAAPTVCLRLPERGTGSFDAPATTTSVEVRSGRVWITSAADACDRVFDAGQSVTIRSAGRVVMTSLLDAHVRVRVG